MLKSQESFLPGSIWSFYNKFQGSYFTIQLRMANPRQVCSHAEQKGFFFSLSLFQEPIKKYILESLSGHL